MARSPITQLIELFHGLTPDQQALFLDQVDPQPNEEEKPARKARKRSAGKSRRASGMAAAINKNLQRQHQSAELCTHVSEDGDDPATCGEPEGNGIHDPAMGYRDYHPFAAPAQSAAGD
jgi:hypothetical protein